MTDRQPPSPAARQRTAAVVAQLLQMAQDPAAFQGGSTRNPNIGSWRPTLRSVDAEVFRDAGIIRARARDLVRNNPTARQAVRISRQGTIGSQFRLVLRPDYKFLGLTHEEATNWARMAERVWEQYAHGLGNWADAGRRFSFSEMMALVHDSDFVDGETVVSAEWAEGRPWKTCFQVIDIDRLSNPNGMPDTVWQKGGVSLDKLGSPTGYYIRQAHPYDVGLIGANTWVWDFVPRETPWYRPIMMHSFDPQRAGQTRGVSEFASVIHALKLGQEYAEQELANATIRAGFVAVLTSAMNYDKAIEMLGELGIDPQAEEGEDPLTKLAFDNLSATAEYYNELNLSVNGTRIPKLAPGDDLKFLGNNTPGSNYSDYIKSQVRNVAAGLGVDPVGISQDFSDVNYSSAKMAWSVNGTHHMSRRMRLIRMVAMPMVGSWMEEAIDSDRLPMPGHLSKADFWAARDALVRGTFLCAGKPVIDPLKERQGQQLGMTMGVETLESVAADEGEHWEERLEQLARENMVRESLGLMPIAALPPPIPEEEDDAGEKPKKKDEKKD